jgi:hypothetical protein
MTTENLASFFFAKTLWPFYKKFGTHETEISKGFLVNLFGECSLELVGIY